MRQECCQLQTPQERCPRNKQRGSLSGGRLWQGSQEFRFMEISSPQFSRNLSKTVMLTMFVLDQGKTRCQFCHKWIHKGTIARHIRHQHQTAVSTFVFCQYCNGQYKNEASLANHLRLKHNVWLSVNKKS